MDEVILHRIVAKHGSHNQASHGHGGKGGASGAGGSPEAQAAREDLNNRASGAESIIGRGGGSTESQRMMHDKRAQGTADGYRTAANYVGKPDKMQALHTQFGGKITNNMSPYEAGIATAINDAFINFGKIT